MGDARNAAAGFANLYLLGHRVVRYPAEEDGQGRGPHGEWMIDAAVMPRTLNTENAHKGELG